MIPRQLPLPTQVVRALFGACYLHGVPVPPDPIRVAIVEDRAEIREGLAQLVCSAKGFLCAGAFDSFEAALPRLTSNAPPHVALIDINLPGMSGIDGIRILHAQRPEVSLVVLTVHTDDDRILEALCAGANGYLLKNTTPQRLLEAIEESASGGAPMSPEIARRVVHLFRRVHPPPKAEHNLTPHELRILNLLVSGENYKTTAAKLKVSVNTISYHVRHIYEKLQVHSRTEAVAKALRHGLFR